MRKKLLWALLVLVTILGVVAGIAFWKAPDIAKQYVHDHYSGVVIAGPVDIHWSERSATFHQVRVTRPGIEAELAAVHVDQHKVIVIDGGSLKVDLDKLKRREGGGPKLNVTAKNLTADIVKGSVRATLEGTSITLNPTEVCFKTAAIEAKGHVVRVTEGCGGKVMASPDIGDPPEPLWSAEAKKVEVPIMMPFDVPRVEREQTLVIDTVKLVPNDIPLIHFEKATLGPVVAHEGAFLLGTTKPAQHPKMGELPPFDHHLELGSIEVDHPWVAPYSVTFPFIRLYLPHALLTGKGTPHEITIQIGKAWVHIDPINWSIRGDASCNDWVEAMPKPLPPALEAARDNFTGRLKFDVRAKPTPHLEIKYDCRYKCSQEPIKSVRGKFDYEVYGSDGKLFTRHTGPYTAGWVALSGLPRHVPEAFRLSEDPGFHSHKGIHVMALQNSLVANLKKGSFVKGGSTISMQLAKNLWLRRHKTIGRKAQEALLTIALESCLSKPQLMEMYMNVVEYAPDVYGIGPATRHYFRKSAYTLQPDEAYYLAMLLPNPRKVLAPNSGGLDRARRRMRRLATSGYISEFLIPEDENDEPIDTSGWVVSD